MCSSSDPFAVDAGGRPALVHDEFVWNLALGSNMDIEKLKTRNHWNRAPIVPAIAGLPATAPGWSMAFDLPALPPPEPAMACAVPANTARHDSPVLHGILYKLSREDYITLSKSEGCCDETGAAISSSRYREVVVEARPYPTHELVVSGAVPQIVYATVFALRKPPSIPLLERRLYPSRRYLDMLIKGAKAAKLDDAYIEFLERHPVARPAPTFWKLVVALVYFAVRRPQPWAKVLQEHLSMYLERIVVTIYSHREEAYAARKPVLELFWHGVLFLAVLPVALFGSIVALTMGREFTSVLRVFRGTPTT